MKTKTKDKLLDVVTGVVFGGLISLHYPLGAYGTVIMVLAVALGLRMLVTAK